MKTNTKRFTRRPLNKQQIIDWANRGAELNHMALISFSLFLILIMMIFMIWLSMKIDKAFADTIDQIEFEEEVKPIVKKVEPMVVPVVKTTEKPFNLDKLAYAVAMQETKNCTLWYWATHNNCFWIKHGNTVPCPWVDKMAMCKFDTPEESYEAFKIIWSKWYWEMPTRRMAVKWSGNDRADIWLKNTLYFYNN